MNSNTNLTIYSDGNIIHTAKVDDDAQLSPLDASCLAIISQFGDDWKNKNITINLTQYKASTIKFESQNNKNEIKESEINKDEVDTLVLQIEDIFDSLPMSSKVKIEIIENTKLQVDRFFEIYSVLGNNPQLALQISELLKQNLPLDLQFFQTAHEKLKDLAQEQNLNLTDLEKIYLGMYLHNNTQDLKTDIILKLARAKLTDYHKVNKLESKGMSLDLICELLPKYGIELLEKICKNLADAKINIQDIPSDHWHKCLQLGQGNENHMMTFLAASRAHPTLLEKFVNYRDLPDAECCVVRKAGWEKNYGNANQKQFGTLMLEGAHVGAELMKTGEQISCVSILNVLALHRKAIGYFLNHRTPDKIGTWRINAKDFNESHELEEKVKYELLVTYLDKEPYEELGHRLTEKFSKLLDQNGMYIFRSTYDQESFQLSGLSFADGERCRLLFHTRSEELEKVMNMIENKIFPSLLAETKPELIMQKAGELFWWLCQAKPWDLGDPSIAEMLIRAIFEYKNIDQKKWRVGIVPWEEVSMETDPKAFGKKFINMFET